MLVPGSNQAAYIRNRVNMPTEKSHEELVGIDQRIKAQAFFSARVADARILDRLRSISDAYSRGDIGLGEARNILKDILQGEGYDPHQTGMRNLASTARLNLVMRQNAAMAHSAGEWARMHDPDAMKVFPYVRYHSRGDSRSRSSHSDLNGNIYHKDDPFLKTHTPPWEFNCRCWLEEITAKEAGKEESRIQKPTPPENVTVDSDSGFAFDPEHAFETFDLNAIKDPEIREEVNSGIGLIMEQRKIAPIQNVTRNNRTTRGIDMRDGGEFPSDGNSKLKSIFNAIKDSASSEDVENKFIQTVAAKDNREKREYIGLWDSNGKPLWIGVGAPPQGNENSANFPVPNEQGYTLVHNHPSGSPPSVADLQTFIFSKMKRMVVSISLPDGKIGKYVLTKKESGDILSMEELDDRFTKAASKYDDDFEILKEILNGTIYEICYIG